MRGQSDYFLISRYLLRVALKIISWFISQQLSITE